MLICRDFWAECALYLNDRSGFLDFPLTACPAIHYSPAIHYRLLIIDYPCVRIRGVLICPSRFLGRAEKAITYHLTYHLMICIIDYE